MRLWTLHPRYLDAPGLVALWREALLAQRVLLGATRGYRHHPQLDRFRQAGDPATAIASFLLAVAAEADDRGYRFNRALVVAEPAGERLEATTGQLSFEARHLAAKLARRNPALLGRLPVTGRPAAHPLFRVVPGPLAPWEREAGRSAPSPPAAPP